MLLKLQFYLLKLQFLYLLYLIIMILPQCTATSPNARRYQPSHHRRIHYRLDRSSMRYRDVRGKDYFLYNRPNKVY